MAGISEDTIADGFYTKISEMEPMMPSDSTGELGDLAIEVIRKSAAISAAVHPVTRESWN